MHSYGRSSAALKRMAGVPMRRVKTQVTDVGGRSVTVFVGPTINGEDHRTVVITGRNGAVAHLSGAEAAKLLDFIDWAFVEMDRRLVEEPTASNETPSEPSGHSHYDPPAPRLDSNGFPICEMCRRGYVDVLWRPDYSMWLCDVDRDEQRAREAEGRR